MGLLNWKHEDATGTIATCIRPAKTKSQQQQNIELEIITPSTDNYKIQIFLPHKQWFWTRSFFPKIPWDILEDSHQ